MSKINIQNILLLEDSRTDAEIVRRLLQAEFHMAAVAVAMSKEDYLFALEGPAPDIILADNSLPQFDAEEALRILRQKDLHIPFILVTGTVSEEFAAGIIRSGADDYILKDRLARLPSAIETAIRKQIAEKENQHAITEIRRSNERFQTLSMATKDAVWDWDLHTDKVWWNDNFLDLLGYDKETPVSDKDGWICRVHPGDRETLLSRQQSIRNNSICSWEDELRLQLPDGFYGTFLHRGYVLRDENENPVRAIGALVNITEQIRLRQAMEDERVFATIEKQKEINRVILRTQEMERNSLGRELHDNINQMLASIYLKLSYYLEEPENNLEIVANCRQILKDTIRETRNLSHNMVLPPFSEKNLKDEIELLLENYSFSKRISLDTQQFSEDNMSSTLKESLFRIAQEQLSNIGKHSGASNIQLRLYTDSCYVNMDIKDNGVGFDLRQSRKGIGLTNILNRVESYNGTAEFITKKGKGCILSVRIPLYSEQAV